MMYQYNWDMTRKSVFRRDKWRCQRCGAKGIKLHAHHIVPVSMGGSDEMYNLVTLCENCHFDNHPRNKMFLKWG